MKPPEGVTLRVVVPDEPSVTVIVVGFALKVKVPVAVAFTTWVSTDDVEPRKFESPP